MRGVSGVQLAVLDVAAVDQDQSTHPLGRQRVHPDRDRPAPAVADQRHPVGAEGIGPPPDAAREPLDVVLLGRERWVQSVAGQVRSHDAVARLDEWADGTAVQGTGRHGAHRVQRHDEAFAVTPRAHPGVHGASLSPVATAR